MALTGVSPTDPIPSTRRELLFAQGVSGGFGAEREVIIYGNKQSSYPETADTIGDPILSDSDAVARFGPKSELYNMYKMFRRVDQSSTVYPAVVTEATGDTASVAITFATTATAVSTLEIKALGETLYVPVAVDDTPDDIASDAADAINAAADGTIQLTAAVVGPILTVSYIHAGARGALALAHLDNAGGADTTHGIRFRFLNSCSMTATKAAITDGSGEDDVATVMALVENTSFYHHIVPWHATGTDTPSSTDGQIGELLTMIRTQAMPINGKEQCMHVGLVCDSASADDVAYDADVNSVRCFLWHDPKSDYTPAMIAALHCAVITSQQLRHPSANVTWYANTDSTPYPMADCPTMDDRLTVTEIRQDLNNGICPIGTHPNGNRYIVRHVTSYSQTAAGTKDYRAREGHITSAVDFAWGIIKQRWETQKQPFVADDPIDGQVPTAKTTTPGMVASMIRNAISDLAASKPLGLYEGPILAPDQVEAMKASVVATKINAGISVSADLNAVEHLLKFEGIFSEVGGAY